MGRVKSFSILHLDQTLGDEPLSRKTMMYLSLAVHEALTFDTELCLHPDLVSSLGGVAAGNFVEICVWDDASNAPTPPHGGGATVSGGSVFHPLATTSSNASVTMGGLPLRRQAQRASSPPPPVAASADTVTDESMGSSTTEHRKQPQNSYSNTTTPQPSPKLNESEKATITPSAAAALLPPPFPRSRAGTADMGKPQPSTTTGTGTVSRRSTTVSRHVRDISDLSDYSEMLGGSSGQSPTPSRMTLDAAHHLVDLQVPFSPKDHDTIADTGTTTTPPNNNFPLHPQKNRVNNRNERVLRLKFYMLLHEASLTSLKPSAQTKISILRQVATLYNLNSYDTVTVHRVSDQAAVRQEMAADFLLITIKDQYLSRGDLHMFQQTTLLGMCLYEGQRIQDSRAGSSGGIQAHAREIRRQTVPGGGVAPMGVVTEHTKIAYRSRSSRIFWLLQMSSELWDYSEPYADTGRCEIYFDKFLAFCYELFAKWKAVDVTHSLTVVFFSRTFWHTTAVPPPDESTAQKDVYGRYYEDHVRLVIENETRTDWNSLVVKIREAFWNYPREVGWNLANDERGRWPSSASQGNVLETINVTLNLLQFHYLDRDLHRSGNSIVLVSAGNGVFEVSKELSEITYQRMMDNGIGSDMLSLGLPPLHTAPFFMYVKQHQAVRADGVDTAEQYFEVPHWMHLSFVSYESDAILPLEKAIASEDAIESMQMGKQGIQVGPDGFILRTWNDDGQSISMSSSPAIKAVKVNSPSRQRREVRQERQLIAGRDFADILRASRPRFSASLPRPFRMLLTSQGDVPESTQRRDVSVLPKNSSGTSDIKEWNAVEADDASDGSIHIRSRGVSLGQDPLDAASPVLYPKSPPRVDMLELMERANSPASSFATQHSGGFLGSSLERQAGLFLSGSSHSPKLTGAQLQRTRSLEFDTENLDGANASSDGSDTDDREDMNHVLDSIKQLMKQTDAISMKTGSPKIVPQQPSIESTRHSTELSLGRSFRSSNLSKSPKFGPRNLSSRSIPSQNPTSGVTGGIGAALLQYRGSTTSISSDTEASANMTRVASAGRLGNSGLLRIPETTKAGMSPLFLPPTQPSSDGVPEFLGSDYRFAGMERRFIEPALVGSMDAAYLRSARARPPDVVGPNDHRSRGLLSTSPPKHSSNSHANLPSSKRASSKTSKKKKAFNPFRQQDEDAVLAEKSHNRRRWSHVFPATEVEFKRHTGPNWKSLSAPAILPISVDYFPPQTKIDLNFTISQYSINISDFEHHNVSTTKHLLMEMVRQRITQDFQLVPRSNVNASNYRKEWLSRQNVFNERPNIVDDEDKGYPLRMFLSMGHRLQVLSYVPSADTVHVTQYTEKKASSEGKSFKYHYLSFSKETGAFVKNVQSFHMYSSPYNWNKVDRILSGDSDRELREDMRVKRLMFVVMPDEITGPEDEKRYISKFQRLLDYFEKLRPKEEADTPMNIRIVTLADEPSSEKMDDVFDSTPGIEGKSMVRFYVQLRKGRTDHIEYAEISLDATFNTSWSYRIIVNWLAASTNKIDQQVQSLQRRCSQYGLSVVVAPQLSVARDVLLNPFRVPTLLSIRDRLKVPLLYTQLISKGSYIYDGDFPTVTASISECIDGGRDFKFRRYGKLPVGRQFVHRSGLLFVRIVVDRQGWGLVVALANVRLIDRMEGAQAKCCAVVEELRDIVNTI